MSPESLRADPPDPANDGAPLRPSKASGRRRVALLLTAVVVIAVAVVLRQPGSIDVPTAVLLGVIEGVTEFLPVSSTGHLTVAERLLDVRGTAADS